jgi:phage-related protein/SLT domain-containing protein
MATITSLGFSIHSSYDGSGVTRARRDIQSLSDTYTSANRSVRNFASASGVLRTAMLGLYPAILPVATVAGAVAAGMAAMTVAAGSAVGAYAAVGNAAAKAALQKAAEGKALTAMEKQYVSAYNSMMKTWQKFVTTSGAKTLQPQIEVIKGLEAGIRKLGPVIDAIHPSIMKVATAFRQWMEGPGFERFRDGVIKYGVPAFDRLQQAGRNALAGLGIGYRTFLPLAEELSKWILKASEAFRNWAEGGGFQRFLDRARENGPAVKELFEALWKVVKKLGEVFEFLAPYSLKAATALANFIAAIPTPVLAGLIGGFILLKTTIGLLLQPVMLLRLVMGPTGLFGIFGRLLPILTKFGGILGIIIGVVTLAWQHSQFFRDAVGGLWDALKQLFAAFQPLIEQFGIFWQKLGPVRELLGQLFGFILGVAVHALTLFVQFLTSLVIGITQLWTAFNNFLSNIPQYWNTAWTWMKETASTIWNAIQLGWNMFVQNLKLAWDTVSMALQTAWSTVWNALKLAAETVWNALKLAWDTLVNGLQIAWTTVSTALSTAWSTVWNGIKTAAETVWNALKLAWDTLVNGLQVAWTTVSTALSTAWSTVWNAIKTAAETVWNALKIAWDAFINGLQTIWTTVSSALSTAWNTVWNALKTAAETVWNALKIAWDAFINGLQTIWNTVSSALSTAWNTVWNALKTAAETVWNGMKTAWDAFINGLQTIWTTVSGALRTAWETVWNGIKTAAETVWNALKTAWETIVNAFSTAWNAVSSALRSAWDTVWNGMKTAAETVWNALKTAWDAFINGVKSVWDTVSTALRSAWDTIWNGMKTAAETVWNALKAAWDTFVNGVKSVWDTVAGALRSAWETAWNFIRTTAENIWNALRTAWNTFLTGVRSTWDSWSEAMKNIWWAVWGWIRDKANELWNVIKTWWNNFLTAVRNTWNTWSEAFKNIWWAVWGWVRDKANELWNVIKTWWSNFLNAVRNTWNSWADSFKNIWWAVWGWVRDKAGELWNVIKSWWDRFLDGVRNLWNSFSSWIKDKWSDTWESLKNSAQSLWQKIGNVVEKAINGVIDIINGLINGFNNISEKLGLTVRVNRIEHVNFKYETGGMVPEFAKGGTVNLKGGGTISGYAPGRDTVPAVLSRGEGVLTPEAVRGLGGPGFVHAANRKFAGHRGAGKPGAHFGSIGAFADGGMVQHFAVGGLTAAALRKAGVPMGLISQGEYSHGQLSAGTHAGGGAVDISSTDRGLLQRLIDAGFAAWIRTPAQGFSPHIHAVLMSHPDLSGPARAQVSSFRQGGSGLGAGAGGSSAPDIAGMLAGKVGKILLNMYRGVDPLLGIGGAIADFFGIGNKGDPAIKEEKSGGDKLSDLIAKADKSGWDSLSKSEQDYVSEHAAKNTSDLFVTTQPAPATGRPPTLHSAPVQTGGNTNTDDIAESILGLLGQAVLALLTRDYIREGLTDPIGELKGFKGGGDFGDELAPGFGRYATDKLVPDYLMNEKSKAPSIDELFGGGGTGNVQQWAPLAKMALARAGLGADQLGRFLALMQAESGGDPMAMNMWDSNAKMGQASRGLMQVIPGTFEMYRDRDLPNNIFDPLANMVAAANYIKSRYGGKVPGSPYANGTPSATKGLHLVGENGPELVGLGGPAYAAFSGGQTVLPADQTAALFNSTPGGKKIQELFKEGGFEAVAESAKKMAESVKVAWTDVNQTSATKWNNVSATTLADATATYGEELPNAITHMQDTSNLAWTDMGIQSATQWGLHRDGTMLQAETHYGTTLPTAITTAQTTSNLAWTDMGLQSATQWALQRDTTMTEAETHYGVTLPTAVTTAQTTSNTAWTDMTLQAGTQYTTLQDETLLPLEDHLGVQVPENAGTMNTETSGAFTEMTTTVNTVVQETMSVLDSFIAKMDEAIAKAQEMIAAAQAAAAAAAAGAAGGGGGGGAVGGGGSGDAAAALAAAGVSGGMIVQGPYSNSVAASAGTHSGGGTYDIASTSQSVLQALIANGFAAWIRSGPGWEGNEHIHAVYMAAPDLSPQAAWQVQDFLRGGSGLGIPGNLARGTNSASRGWTWVGEEGPELMWMRGGEKVMPYGDSMSWIQRAMGSGNTSDAMRNFRRAGRAIGEGARSARSSYSGRDDCNVNVEFNFNGPVNNGDDVRRAVDEAIPKLRSALQARSGARRGG